MIDELAGIRPGRSHAPDERTGSVRAVVPMPPCPTFSTIDRKAFAMTHEQIAREFLRDYTQALLSRDARALAAHYAVPALIEAPSGRLTLSDSVQAEQFFAAALGPYEQVTAAEAVMTLVAGTDHSIWIEATWTYDQAPSERDMYQLVAVDGSWKIAVLTPLPH